MPGGIGVQLNQSRHCSSKSGISQQNPHLLQPISESTTYDAYVVCTSVRSFQQLFNNVLCVETFIPPKIVAAVNELSYST